MPDERCGEPFWLLGVARRASTEALEAAFAQRYKAARRGADSDGARQALNAALETLRDEDRRADAEATGWHWPLDPAEAPPSVEAALAALLPPAPDDAPDPLEAVPGHSAVALVAAWLAARPGLEWPDDDLVLRALAARQAIEQLDPWGGEP